MKKSVAITILTLTTLLYIVASCTSRDARLGKLDSIDSLMEQNPQAAYDSLCHDKEQMTENSPQNVTMRYRLLEAKAQNKLYLQMPSDSAFQEVVEYYEANGTSNDKMQAYYLQGCVYRDQKEAPKAILCYQEALERADTLSKSCDNSTMYRIYAQMEDIYEKQYLWNEALKANYMFGRFALKAGELHDYLRSKEMLIPIYYCLGDTLQALKQTKSCACLYDKNGLHLEAARVLPLMISIYVRKRQNVLASHYMQIYETQSGLFDHNGNIAKGYEAYYEQKGLYFLGVDKLDSAEYYFRKLERHNYIFQANRGLLLLAKARGNSNDMYRYALLCEKGMDKILKDRNADAVLQVSSMYQYQRMQQQMLKKKEEAVKNRNTMYILLLLLFVFFWFGLFFYNRYKKHIINNQKKLESLNDKYIMALDEMNALICERNKNKEEYEGAVQQKQNEINSLKGEIQKYRKKIKRLNDSERDLKLADQHILRKFREMVTPRLYSDLPSSKDWEDLESLFASNFPITYEKIQKDKDSLVLEFRVCVLTRLQFSNGAIANLLQSTPASISNAKSKANKRIFGDRGASTLYYNMVNISLR